MVGKIVRAPCPRVEAVPDDFAYGSIYGAIPIASQNALRTSGGWPAK
jgi:hypothetical protein